jgi:hypothetical protein
VLYLKQTLEAANRQIFSLEREALHLAEENKVIKVRANKDIDDLEDFIKEHEKGVSRTKKNLEITILEKDDFIKSLQIKLKAKEDPVLENDLNNLPATQSEELNPEERYEEGEEDVEITEANPWHVKQGTTFKCPICSFTRKTESQIRNHMQVHDNTTSTNPTQERTTKRSSPKCPICGHTSNTIIEIERHMKCHDDKEEDSMFNCKECDFQSMNNDQLKKHLVIKHEMYTCNTCNIICNGKEELNTHILRKHKSNKPCKNFASNSCDYEECRFKHIILKDNEHICYNCGEKTSSLRSLMKHIQEEHGSQPCLKFSQNKCSRGQLCWYSHGESHPSQNQATKLDFRPRPSAWGQPVRNQREKEEQVQQMSEKLQHLNITQQTQTILEQIVPTLVKQIIQALKQ